ncbi:MAG TPA: hypothetical protein VJN96_04240 [Vicinamibacterales bacterium]|nr:hypothetical protein [Vicinamibacterales bacterium]
MITDWIVAVIPSATNFGQAQRLIAWLAALGRPAGKSRQARFTYVLFQHPADQPVPALPTVSVVQRFADLERAVDFIEQHHELEE